MPSESRLTVTLSDGFRKKLKFIADRESRSQAWVVRKAIESYLNKNYISEVSAQLSIDSKNSKDD